MVTLLVHSCEVRASLEGAFLPLFELIGLGQRYGTGRRGGNKKAMMDDNAGKVLEAQHHLFAGSRPGLQETPPPSYIAW